MFRVCDAGNPNRLDQIPSLDLKREGLGGGFPDQHTRGDV